MAFTVFRGMKPMPQLMFSIFVIVASFLIFFFLALVIAVPVFHLDSLLSIPNVSNLNDPGSIEILKYFQTVQSIGLFIIPPIILGWLYLGNIPNYLFLNKTTSFASILIVLILMFSVAPVINFTGTLNSEMKLPEWLSGLENWMKQTEDSAAELTNAFLNVKTTGGLLFNIFMVALLPAIGEEFIFRGVVQRSFTRMTQNHHLGIWISAIFFSALHMQFYGFLPRLLLGALFGYLLVWSGSMWLPILAHFLNNGIAVVSLYMIDREMISPDIETVGSTPESYFYTFISVAVVAGLLFLFWHENKKNKLPAPKYIEN